MSAIAELDQQATTLSHMDSQLDYLNQYVSF